MRYSGYYTGYFDGSIDEVYIYSSALDAASIQVLYAAVTAAPTVTPLPTHVSHSTLVAHYSFDDGTAADDSGAGLDGWVSGATATTGLDARGALAFDGSGQYAGAGMVSSYLSAALPRTVCVWAVVDAFDGGALFSVGSDADGREFGLSTDSGNPTPVDGRIQVQFYGGDPYDTDVDVAGSDDGAWHHYCLTYDGSDWALYFDGLYEAGEVERPVRPVVRLSLIHI